MKNLKAETVQEKADRLRKNHRVIVVGHEKVLVIGESDTYLVQKQGISWTCDCKWGRYRGHLKDCSHVVAAKQARKDPLGQATVARLADWLMEAKVG